MKKKLIHAPPLAVAAAALALGAVPREVFSALRSPARAQDR